MLIGVALETAARLSCVAVTPDPTCKLERRGHSIKHLRS
jgi:hypothetical protein